MSLTLSSADVTRYRAASTALLSPLDASSFDGWRTDCLTCMKNLSGADAAAFNVPVAGYELIHTDRDDTRRAIDAYVDYYHRFDFGLHQKRKELGLEVFNLESIYDPAELWKIPIQNEWAVPYRLLDCLAMGFEVNGGFGMASLHLYHNTSRARPFGDTGLAVLGLMLPAFKAGVATARMLEQHRTGLARTLDSLTVGILLANATGGVVHQNPALSAMLAADPERDKLHIAIRLVARDTASHASTARGTPGPHEGARVLLRVQTGNALYRVRGSLCGQRLFHDRVVVIVTVDCVSLRHPSTASLREQHGFTQRQAQVAALIAHGTTSEEIAAGLGISRHTVRRHTERILQKLGVHTRAAVNARLRAPLV